jgi:hypothetical protein
VDKRSSRSDIKKSLEATVAKRSISPSRLASNSPKNLSARQSFFLGESKYQHFLWSRVPSAATVFRLDILRGLARSWMNFSFLGSDGAFSLTLRTVSVMMSSTSMASSGWNVSSSNEQRIWRRSSTSYVSSMNGVLTRLD